MFESTVAAGFKKAEFLWKNLDGILTFRRGRPGDLRLLQGEDRLAAFTEFEIPERERV